MTLTNRDCSQVTLKKTQKALFAWKATNDASVIAGRSVLKEQSSSSSSRIVVDRQQGGCKCAKDALENPYEFNGLGNCGCGA